MISIDGKTKIYTVLVIDNTGDLHEEVAFHNEIDALNYEKHVKELDCYNNENFKISFGFVEVR